MIMSTPSISSQEGGRLASRYLEFVIFNRRQKKNRKQYHKLTILDKMIRITDFDFRLTNNYVVLLGK